MHTFGFPVVPDVKHKNASLILASPGRNFLSTIVGSTVLSPWSTKCSIVWWWGWARLGGDLTSKSMMCSREILHARAAESAVSNASGCTIITDALVSRNWYWSSSLVRSGLAPLKSMYVMKRMSTANLAFIRTKQRHQVYEQPISRQGNLSGNPLTCYWSMKNHTYRRGSGWKAKLTDRRKGYLRAFTPIN